MVLSNLINMVSPNRKKKQTSAANSLLKRVHDIDKNLKKTNRSKSEYLGYKMSGAMLKTIEKNSGKQDYVHKKLKSKKVGKQTHKQLRTMHMKTGWKMRNQNKQKIYITHFPLTQSKHSGTKREKNVKQNYHVNKSRFT